MSLRNVAQFVFGSSFLKFIPKNSDGSTPLPYPGKAEVAAFSGVGPFDFSGATVPAAVPLSIKINTVVETKTINLVTPAPANIAAVTVTELMTAITTATFAGVTAAIDARGYGKVLATGKDGEVDYIQVYGEAATLGYFGFGFGLQFRYSNTQKTFVLTPTNVEDEKIETIDINGLKTYVVTPGYRDGLTAAMTEGAVDDALRTLFTGGSYDTVNKIYLDPTAESFRPLLSFETESKMYLKNGNQKGDWVGTKITRAFNMSAKEDSIGDGARNFQDPGYSFNGTDYKDPTTGSSIGASSTQDYTKAAFEALAYESI